MYTHILNNKRRSFLVILSVLAKLSIFVDLSGGWIAGNGGWTTLSKEDKGVNGHNWRGVMSLVVRKLKWQVIKWSMQRHMDAWLVSVVWSGIMIIRGANMAQTSSWRRGTWGWCGPSRFLVLMLHISLKAGVAEMSGFAGVRVRCWMDVLRREEN